MNRRLTHGLVLGAALLAATPIPGPAQHAGHGHAAADTARKSAPRAPQSTAQPGAGQAGHLGHAHKPAAQARSGRQERARTDSADAAPNGPGTHAGHGHPTAGAESPGTPGSLALAGPTLRAGGDSADAPAREPDGTGHEMLMVPLGGGWSVMGMAQAFPIATAGEPLDEDSPLNDTETYLTQPAAMINLASPGQRLVLRTTLNFEAETQRDGEYTFGGWGEGYLDKRHPHTFLHEAMLSLNVWNAPGGAFSLSAGKGFAPYGTDDPMSRPVVKYPTNHHLSQVLERWTLNGVYLHRSGFSVEAGLFGGAEPEGPSDFGNIESFGDSWSARLTQRFGGGFGPAAPWEVSASYARVEEAHHGAKSVTHLANAALRHERAYGFGNIYALAEASRSEPGGDADGYYSLIGETQLGLGRTARHLPYYRVEYATRPEYDRGGSPGSDGFFRYDHDSHTVGSTRWLVNTAGYGYDLTGSPLSLRPFVEVQHNRVWGGRGDVDPEALFGKDRFWSLSAGFRVFLGGGPMRMGSYGVLDPMSAAMRPGAPEHAGSGHGGH